MPKAQPIALFILLMTAFFCPGASSQTLFSRWQYAWGGNRQEFLGSMIPVPGNQYLFIGASASDASTCTKTSAIFDAPGGTGEDGVAFLMDDAGNKVWEKSYGGSSWDQLYDGAIVPSGGYILIGYTESSPSGNKTSAYHGGGDLWVVRIDNNGNLLWERSYGGSQLEQGVKIIPTADGGFLVGGYCIALVPNYDYGKEDFLAMKIDAGGNLIWQNYYGSSGNDELIDMIQTSDGNFLLSGYSDGPADGTKTSAPLGQHDNWLVSITPDGVKRWDKSYGGSADDFTGSLVTLNDGNYLLVSSKTNYGVIRKLDIDGNILWEQDCGGNYEDYFVRGAQSPDGTIYIAGTSFASKTNCKTSPLYGGTDDIWICVFDANGQKIDDVDFGGSDFDLVTDIDVVNNEVWITGWSDSHLNGNKTVDNCGQTADGWIIRLGRKLFITPPTPVELCNSASGYVVSFSAYNIYLTGNTFTVQLSDKTGSFTTPVSIGSAAGTSPVDIPVILPTGMDMSGNYKIRIVSTMPEDISSSYPLLLHGPPQVMLGNDTTICADRPLTLNASPQLPSSSWLWNDGSTQPTLSVSQGGTYSCQVTNGCGTATGTINVVSNVIPRADIGKDIDFCSGASPTLSSNPQPADVQYLWNTGATTPAINISNGGSYTLQCSNMCGSSTATVVATMHPLPQSPVDKDSVLCEGTTRKLDAGPGYKTYNWNDGSNGEFLVISGKGVYWVEITDAHSCTARDTVDIRIVQPVPADFLPSDTAICSYDKLRLNAAGPLSDYNWSTGETTAAITVTSPGTYWLLGTDKYGCTGSDTIQVATKQCLYGFFMPSAFTPNNDGKNDYCHPLIHGILLKMHFEIYDR
jgi:hypothetical protein